MELSNRMKKEDQHMDRVLNEDAVQHMNAIFEAMADGVFVYDSQSRLIKTNLAGRNLLGGENLYTTFSSSLQEGAERFRLRTIQGEFLIKEQWPVTRLLQGEELKGTQGLDVLLRTLDGRDRLFNLSGTPIRTPQGDITGAVILARDVTDARFQEQRTHEVLDALLQMAQSMVQRKPAIFATDEGQPLSARRVTKHLAELTRKVLGCRRLGLSQVELQTGRLRPLAVVGLSPEQEQQWWSEQLQQESFLGDGLSSEQNERLHQNEVLLFDLRQPPWNKLPNPYDIKTMLIAPLCLGTQVLGLLSLDYGGQEHEYTTQEIALVQATTHLLALTLERDYLEHANGDLNSLIALAHDAIIVRTPQGHITFWNQGAERLYGWKSEQAIGQVTHTLLHTRFPKSLEHMETVLAQEGRWEGELLHWNREGVPLVVESRQALVRDELGQPSVVLEINRDITERERLQREQVQAQANEQAAQESARLMDEFLGIAGHELRTPLTTIKASIQLSKRNLRRVLTTSNVLPEQVVTTLHLMEESLERAERQIAMQNRLLGDLLDVSRIHANQLALSMEVCDIATVVSEVVDDQHFLHPHRTITLSGTDEGAEMLVMVDRDRLRQVVNNYLTNALKYSEENKPVSVRVEQREAAVYVSVTDQGPGISHEDQQRIWSRFSRIEGIAVKSGSGVGLGLGLYICRTLIERQNGQVGIESQLGEGSTFWFCLPLHDPSIATLQ